MSFIEFLNSVPLGWSFVHGEHKDAFDLRLDVPSECARHLAESIVDVGLIPVIEYQNIPDLEVLPGICVASRREVRSVLFVSRLPFERIRTVAVDSSSRTSVALLRILLEVFHGRPEIVYRSCSPDPRKMLEEQDAALIIGNAALRLPPGSWQIYDLANEWFRFTGLPFVFAFWAVRSGVDLGRQAELFYFSRTEGLERLGEIAELYSKRLGISTAEIKSYVRNNLDYNLDEQKLESLDHFYHLAAGHGLIPAARPLQFYHGPDGLGERSGCAREAGP